MARTIGLPSRKPQKTRVEVPIRITLLSPPPGVFFCVQGRDDALLDRRTSSGADLSFDVIIQAERVEGAPRFFGDVTQGPPSGRFVYVCSGARAGQFGSGWTRRAKVPLGGISWGAVEAVVQGKAQRVEARFDGTAKDGGPVCATVKLRGDWSLSA
jgi:Family of unknown function (DUF5990)